MNISQEFVLSLIIQLLILAFFAGLYVATIKFMGEQIKELKEKLNADREELKDEMRKYNGVLERMIINEQSVKAAWHVLDEIKVCLKQ